MSKGWFGGPNNKFKLGIKNRVKCKCLICGKEFEIKNRDFLMDVVNIVLKMLQQ